MIVNQEFIDELQITSNQDVEDFERTLNYTISYIAKSDTSTKLNEVLEIDEETANELLHVYLKLVSFFAKFNAGEREFKAHLDILSLAADKKQLFTFKMKENEKHLRKTLGLLERDNEQEYANLKWRFDLQVRLLHDPTKKKRDLRFYFNSTLLMIESNLIETDYANLKHLYEELNSALKMHDSLQQRKIQKKFN